MLFTFVLLIAITSLTVARQQTFTATGTLQCNNKPAAGQTVQLKFTDPLLKGKVDATVKTAADGSFKISGTKRARASQKAYLWIEHNCDAKQRICMCSTTEPEEREERESLSFFVKKKPNSPHSLLPVNEVGGTNVMEALSSKRLSL
ncbi:hypothetical protein Y032_0042g606 [Ancylostoma ceylanicum]|uniref:Transthyretin-like family protein n=1 Tax=Ancylostoma ceylanicum TaxID=53326 RepID=A0A016UH39_9BILA|nr:hypothetical protein Y032_0042g606 [Ancylostoma ceylanicum]